LSASASVTGAGSVRFTGGATTFDNGAIYDIGGTTTVAGGDATFNNAVANLGTALTISSETARFNQPLTTAIPVTLSGGGLQFGAGVTSELNNTLTWSGGSLGGAGNFNINGAIAWTGGTKNGAGTVQANAGLTISGTASKAITGGWLINAANAVVNGTGNIGIEGGGSFSNVASATFEDQVNATFAGNSNCCGISNGSFSNTGAFVKSGSTGATRFTNGGYGAVSLSTAGSLNVRIGGLAEGVDFDQYRVGATATLGGVLNVSLINSYTPNVGDSFKIITFNSRAGSFSTINGLEIGNGLVFQPVYNPQDLTLVVGTVATADLAVTLIDSPDPVQVGDNLTYTATVTNNGPAAATGVTLTDTLPAGVTFVSATPTQGSCVNSSGAVTCSIGALANSASATVTIVVTPTATGTITNTVNVAANLTDDNPSNNSASQTTTVNPKADLSIAKTDSPDPATTGHNLTYTITVTNHGPSNAAGVTVSDTLPAGVAFVSASSGCSNSSGTVTCNLGAINNGASASVTIVVKPNATGALSNTASVTSSTFDPNTANNSATQSTTVNANQPPVAVNDTATTNEDAAITISVLSNDSDPENDALTITSVTQGANGAVTINAGATVRYTPNTNFNGSDSFTYTVNDGLGGTSTATVTVTVNAVNDPPVANSQSVTTNEDTAKAITLTASDVDGDPLTWIIVSPPAHGGLSGTAPNLTYTPAANYNGPDSFTFKVNDGAADSNVATISITVVAINDPPVAANDGYSVNEDAALIIAASGVLGNDGDVDGGALTAALVSGPSHGALVLNADGSFSYSPTADYFGPDSFTYRASDGSATSNIATVSITVNPVNDAPVVTGNPATQTAQYSDPIASVSFTAADVDSSGSALAAAVSWKKVGDASYQTTSPLGGLALTLTSTAANTRAWTLDGKALVAPGAYLVRVTVNDGQGGVGFVEVTINVAPEDARATYTGALFASTSCATCNTAAVTLAATIQDITAADPGSDPNFGDIRNATVTFINRDTNTAINPTPVPVGLVNMSDTKTGTATYTWNASIGSANSQSFTIGVIVNGWYARNDSAENTVVTLSKPLATDFITGGGYLVMSNSGGRYPGDPGAKNNFGFNVKYNKSGTNLQGQINVIVRSGGRVYQIKGNSMTSLAVTGNKATFNGKASIQDITDPAAPVSIDGNATLQVTLTDNGEPGANDSIGITLWDKNGGLWFSSKWDGTKTVEQTLGGGNVVAH
jgi:uncharacterized repeat protein (TIGR01451 family)